MKRILALDTSSENCSVALLSDGQVTSKDFHSPRQHSQKLLAMVDELLAAAKVDLSSIDSIAFGCGPGSFTGVRICFAVVQGLAFAADIPVIPISTLFAMAERAVTQGVAKPGQTILVAVDARMDELYWGLYRCAATGVREIEAICADAISPVGRLGSEAAVSEVTGDNLVIVGSGLDYPEIAAVSCASHERDFLPRAIDLIAIAQRDDAKHVPVDAQSALPVYLRDSVAWKKRQRIRNKAG